MLLVTWVGVLTDAGAARLHLVRAFHRSSWQWRLTFGRGGQPWLLPCTPGKRFNLRRRRRRQRRRRKGRRRRRRRRRRTTRRRNRGAWGTMALLTSESLSEDPSISTGVLATWDGHHHINLAHSLLGLLLLRYFFIFFGSLKDKKWRNFL